eukprot:scaffold1962_cov241-Pinguiococcus_pyrenoidosus.AAC.5
MDATQIHLAASTPKATGSDCSPIARSPARAVSTARGQKPRGMPFPQGCWIRTFDALEVVHDCDTEPRPRVQERQHANLIDRAASMCEPGADVCRAFIAGCVLTGRLRWPNMACPHHHGSEM